MVFKEKMKKTKQKKWNLYRSKKTDQREKEGEAKEKKWKCKFKKHSKMEGKCQKKDKKHYEFFKELYANQKEEKYSDCKRKIIGQNIKLH